MRPMASLLLLPVLVTGLACQREVKRPAGVPTEAFWIGEPKTEGHFLRLERRVDLGWVLQVYHAKTGALLASGEFRLLGSARAEILPTEVKAYDGRNVLLLDGGVLAPAPTK